MQPGQQGVWFGLHEMTAPQAADFARRIEDWGYTTLWIPEGRTRNALVLAGWLLANTTKLIVATGIANIYARDPMAMKNAQRALAEQSDGRFLLGVGVSHRPMVEIQRGHVYGKPVATMRAYLEAMQTVPYVAPRPRENPQTVVAALGPKMMGLAAELADGAHPYNTTPEHTEMARRILGRNKLLCPEVWVLLENDPARARHTARVALAHYMVFDNYLRAWRHLGFSEDDLTGGGSDRFIDSIVAWGDETALRRRIRQHLDAGADHVCVQPVRPTATGQATPAQMLELLAPSAI